MTYSIRTAQEGKDDEGKEAAAALVVVCLMAGGDGKPGGILQKTMHVTYDRKPLLRGAPESSLSMG